MPKLKCSAFCYARTLDELPKDGFCMGNAGIAQLVEQLICNQQVVGSNPTAGSFNLRFEIMREPR